MDQKKNKQNKPGSTKDREEYGYGYDISIDDLGVIGQNDAAKKQNRNGRQRGGGQPGRDDR